MILNQRQTYLEGSCTLQPLICQFSFYEILYSQSSRNCNYWSIGLPRKDTFTSNFCTCIFTSEFTLWNSCAFQLIFMLILVMVRKHKTAVQPANGVIFVPFKMRKEILMEILKRKLQTIMIYFFYGSHVYFAVCHVNRINFLHKNVFHCTQIITSFTEV